MFSSIYARGLQMWKHTLLMDLERLIDIGQQISCYGTA